MRYKMIDEHTYVVILAPGEEIVEKLGTFLEQESIDNACFSGIGALKKAELAHYRVDTRKYSSINSSISSMMALAVISPLS